MQELGRADANPHRGDRIGTVQEMYDGRLSPDGAVRTFRNIDRLFPVRVVERSTKSTRLSRLTRQLTALACSSRGMRWGLDEYIAANRVSGLLVLKNGRIALERYALGSTPRTRWMSMSIAKSITSTLIGAAIHDGSITSLDDPVSKYLISLSGTAYDGVTVRQILTMTSGVKWNETYTDPTSDRRELLAAQVAQLPGAALAAMTRLPRVAEPGTRFNYSTGETLIAGYLLREAVGMSLSEYLSAKIWKPLGMESVATWWLDMDARYDGREIGGSGFSATLRDYARFGQFFMSGGRIRGESILPTGWMEEAGSQRLVRPAAGQQYGYMWWPMDSTAHAIHAGAFAAEGIFGQWIYINPREQLVVVQLSALTQPSGGEKVTSEDCFAAIANALHEQ
jgi:CubicO group peptidase (beta-lactamase class C family)